MQIERLTRGERMSKQHFAPEGALPKNCGKKFYALKRLPIRGYCWLSSTHTSKYFISHYISKDFNKLRAEDISKVHTNWGRIEEQGDER